MRGGRLRHRRRLRGARGRPGRRARAAARAGGRARRHVAHVRRPLLPRRRHGGAAGDRPRGLRRGDGEVPEPSASKEPDPDKIRAYCEGCVEHFDWLEALGFEFERSYYPEKAVIQPGTEGLMFTGNEKVLAVPRPRQARAARPQGAGARRHRRHQDGDGPAARRGSRRPASRSATRPAPPTSWPRRDGAVVGVGLEVVRRAPASSAPASVVHRRRRLRDEPRHGRGVHPARWARSCSRSARPTTTGSASGSARRSAASSSTWRSRSSPRRSTRRRSW